MSELLGRKLKLEYHSPNILPEIYIIIEEMIRLYNNFDEYGGTAYLKLNSANTNTSSSRYELYKDKSTLLQAILANCPTLCSISSE